MTGYESMTARSMTTPVPLTPQTGYSNPVSGTSLMPVVNGKQPWSSKRKLLTTAVLLLVVLLIISSGLFAALKLFGKTAPMSTATVTIVPTHATQSSTYAMTAIPGKSAASALQVHASMLSATVQQTNTVASSGVGTVPATVAQGSLTLYNDSTSSQPFSAGAIFTGNDGVQVMILQSGVIPAGNPETNPVTWQTVVIPARAVKAGHSGNIAKNDINSWKKNGSKSNFVAQNFAPFSGGRDTLYYPVVENSDLTSAATPLTRVLLRKAQTAVLAQVQLGEQIAATPRCTQQAISNHHAGDSSATVSVILTTTCTLETYDQQGAVSLAISQLKHRLMASRSTMLLPVFTATVLQAQTLDSKGTISLLVKAVNTTFSTAQLQNMARAIAGKSSSDAETTLLRMKGVKRVSIHGNGGDGQTLPSDVTRISVIVSGS